MLQNTALYAAKKRKKPVQKIPKPAPPDGAKSNPSKRHRDRLNGELDKLTSLLPFTEEVRARLDKLSVLRLSVGYLKVKSFFNSTMKAGQSSSSWSRERSLVFGGNAPNPLPSSSSSIAPPPSVVASIDGVSFSEGDLLLQALNGFVLVVTAEGYVFYTSPTIQDFLGFHQSDVVHQSVFELIHTDDRALFRRQLHFSLKPSTEGSASASEDSSAEVSTNLTTYNPLDIPPENSSFLERNFCCRFRCLLDNSSGFLALNFHGRLKFLHGQNRVSDDGTLVPPQLALFAIATPLQPPSILEIRTKTLIFQSKHKMDFTPMGIDSRGKMVLGYNEIELCMKGSGYSFIHAADMMYCADNHLRMMKTGDTGFTFFRLLTKRLTWVWVQANARVVFKAGKPDFIVARQRALTDEEGEEQLRLRRLQLPFTFTTGEAMLYDTLPTVDVQDPCSAPKQTKLDENSVSSHSILGSMLNQDQSAYCEPGSSSSMSALNDQAFQDTHATVSILGDMTAKPDEGMMLKVDGAVQDIMDTLQQILGDGDLTDVLEVGSDELKSWESTLLKMNHSAEFPEDLNDILNNDILSYVEEQLQKEMSEGAPTCLSTMDLQSQNAQQQQQSFGWSLENQNQDQQLMALPKLSHLDLPPLSSVGLHHLPADGSAFNSTSCPQTHNLLLTHNNNNSLTPLPQLHANQPTHLPLRTPQSTDQCFDPAFSFQGGPWTPTVSSSKPAVEMYNSNISNDSVFSKATPSCRLQGRFTLTPQNGDAQRQSWPLEQRPMVQISGFQNIPTDVSSQPPIRTLEAPVAPFTVQQNLEPSNSCMFGNVAPLQHVNSLYLNQCASKPSCFYQSLPASEPVPAVSANPNQDMAALSCQMAAGLNSNGLLVQQHQPYVGFTNQTQVNTHPPMGNTGFAFPSLPNGNTCYSENK
ncbi:aryl hydrocarbon receptor-like [Gouania willdenowi]|uniref:Aryl hydrocarbon receptor n=1 Tax=Gouania willdenowi TaxID=441366 RepID=A0A8C5D757_GOUWI|nr:aryl hydrocarbon receptor-like [Gouania willdenowi]